MAGTIRELSEWLLNYLYNAGGKDFESFNLPDAKTEEKFGRRTIEERARFSEVINHLLDSKLIQSDPPRNIGLKRIFFDKAKLTSKGIEYIEKQRIEGPLKDIPQIGIVTGDHEIDKRLGHARNLFLQQPQSIEILRSACKEMMDILEPIRYEIESIQPEVEQIFFIANKFTVRHNKNNIATLDTIPKLKWFYFTCLNTVVFFYSSRILVS